MALSSKELIPYGIKAAWFLPVASDVEGAGGYTLGALTRFKGIQEGSVNLETTTDELRGDNKVIDIYSKMDKVSGSISSGVLNLENLPTLLGGSLQEHTDVTHGDIASYIQSGGALPGYFQLIFYCDYRGGAAAGTQEDKVIIIPKAKLTSFEWSLQEGYAAVSADFEGAYTANEEWDVSAAKDGSAKDSILVQIMKRELAGSITAGFTP